MARKRIKVSRRMLFTWCILAGLILFFSPQTWTNTLQFAFARAFRWPLSVGRNISLAGRTRQYPQNAKTLRDVQYQNYIANLEEQLRQKQEKIELLQGLRDRLYALEGAGLMVADVIKCSIDASRGELIINRGENEGLAVGQYVLGDNSIIGVISGISARQARVKLITDSTFKTDTGINIPRLKVEGMMRGNGNNTAAINLVKHQAKVGDGVFINKKPGFLDAPMIIGRVIKCQKNPDTPLLWDIVVAPACEIETLNVVAVIIMNPEK